MIPALVLTAGLATRLRPLSLVRAKAAMPVAGEPLVRRILRQLRHSGITESVLNLHHLPHTITRALGDGSDLGLRVRYSWEVPILGSAGGPRQALPLLGGATFLIANGDTLSSVDVAALIAKHRRDGSLVTLAVVPNTEPDKYGGAVIDAGGAVTGFTTRGSSAPSYHFVGVQVVEPDAFSAVSPGTRAESVGRVYPDLIAARPGCVRAYISDAAFLDIGTPGDYLRTSLRLAAREAGATLRGVRSQVAPTAHVEDSILWDEVEVQAGSRLRQCIVADGTCVPAGTSWTCVTLRQATGALSPGERRVGALAVAPL